MSSNIALLLTQDGIANGLIYALISLSILIVFLVTKIFWIPAGEFVIFGALTMGLLSKGQFPVVVWLSVFLSICVLVVAIYEYIKLRNIKKLNKILFFCTAYPLVSYFLGSYIVPQSDSIWLKAFFTVFLIFPLAPLLYLTVFKSVIKSTILIKLIVAVALHMVLVGIGLYFFGPEGSRSPALITGKFKWIGINISYQFVLILSFSIFSMFLLWLFFEKTLWGKSLKATAINQLGARLVAIHTEKVGILAFSFAGLIGAVSGVLISSTTTVYYDSGFLLALKGFIGVVAAGMVSFPIAVISSVAIGVIDSFSAFYTSSLRDIIVFSALIPILIFRSLTDKNLDQE